MPDQDSILTALRQSADEVRREVERLPAEAALWRPGEGEWSQHETLTHLWIADHFIFLPRLQAMARQENPPLPVIDEVALQRAHWDAARPRDDLLAGFLADRRAELALLEAHPWDRPGVHGALGPISIGWVAQYAMGHTWEHLSQMLRVRLYYTVRGPGRAA
jgi:hypothetical protein